MCRLCIVVVTGKIAERHRFFVAVQVIAAITAPFKVSSV